MEVGSLFVMLNRHLSAESDPCVNFNDDDTESEARARWPQECDVATVLLPRLGEFVEAYRQLDRDNAQNREGWDRAATELREKMAALDHVAQDGRAARDEIDRVRVEAHNYQRERDDAIDILGRIAAQDKIKVALPSNLRDRLKEWSVSAK